MVPSGARHRRAALLLLGATALWGVSFPLTKALALAQSAALAAGASTWFLTAATLVFRFGLAAGLLALFSRNALRRMSRAEIWQGCGLGFFGGAGMLLQIDGLNYTAASTAAFLTASFVVIIPLVMAVQHRRAPSWRILSGIVLAAVGMTILSGVDPIHLRLGRGEAENVLAACLFAAQILWLERPRFQSNRTAPVTVVMFVFVAVLNLPVLLATARHSGEIATALGDGAPTVLAFLLTLTLLCTVCTFTVMNHWQKELPATEAGLIYCAEPVWAALLSLGLPAWLAAWSGIAYANEQLTSRLLLGGGLITLANVLAQLRPRRAQTGEG